MFETEFEGLSRSEQKQWSESLNSLLFHCFIVRRVYDRAKQMSRINGEYLFIESHLDLINSYLSYSDLEADIDDINGVIYLRSLENRNSVRLDGVTTLTVYLLRYAFEKSIAEKPNTTEVYMDSNDLKDLLKDKGFLKLNKKLNFNSVSAALKNLAAYNVVAKCENTFSDSYYSFYIMPSIKHVISSAKMNALHEAIVKDDEEENVASEEEEVSL